jgi:hypothetical protein
MKKSEKILLGLFSLLFLVIIGGSVVKWAWSTYQEVQTDITRLSKKLSDMQSSLTQADQWQTRATWLDQRMPQFTSHEQASSTLFELVQKQATTSNLTITAREMLPQRTPVEGEAQGNYDQASVKLTLTDVTEESLFQWMHSLTTAQPHPFIGITRMQLQPGGKQHTVACEIDITQFYLTQEEPSKVAQAPSVAP